MAHTPGPWQAQWIRPDASKGHKFEPICNIVAETPTGKVRIADIPDPLTEEEESNARLMAAAPGMLEALLDAEAGLLFAGADIEVPEGDFIPTPTLALRSVRAAIAKAKGG